MNKKRGTFLVVLGLFLLVSFSFLSPADTAGCYIYPEASEDLYCVAGVLDTDAQADCDFYDSCSINEHFIPASDCSELDECQEITCTVDCQLHAQGVCTQLGGIAVPEDEYDLWCSPGCCKIADKFCQFNLYKYECDDKAKKLGVSGLPIFKIGIDLAQCNQDICQVEIEKGSLTVYVQDETNKPIPDAEVSLSGTTLKLTTEGSGKVTFSDLNLGTYSLIATATDYASGSLVVSLSSGEEAEQTITLQKSVGIADITGIVKDSVGPLPEATVSWSGPVSGQTFTDENGEYKISQLPKGDYSITASKVGFQSKKENPSVTTAGTSTLNFELGSEELLGISGQIYIDSNNNKELDPDDPEVYGASIYLDDIFKGYSKYDDGAFTIEVQIIADKETHNISALYQNYQFEDSFIFEKGKSLTNQHLLLTTYVGVCTEPDTELPVEEFSVVPVPGEKVLKLEWTKPCPEVIGYEIEKYQGEIKLESLSASPAENFILDGDVEWGQDYNYRIIAFYDKSRFAINEDIASTNVGDKHCENRYQGEPEGWDTFCLVGEKEIRKTIWKCDNFNQLEVAKNCAENDEPSLSEDYYCTQTTSKSAICQNAGGCGSFPQQADPFGLYYGREKCYGTDKPEETSTNYCYYDYSDTIFNQCKECKKINNCFDYQSEDACLINNCLGTECKWIDSAADSEFVDYSLINLPLLVTSETGGGYCVENDYSGSVDDPQGNNYCDQCGPEANLFENYFCTAEVCSGLGRCFSAFTLDQCSSCGDFPTSESNCYAYNTEMECTGQQDLQRDPYGKITLSNDECGWGRCSWTGTSNGYNENGCVKDGDGNNKPDCESFSSGSEKSNCKLDNSAPKTKVLPEGINVISYAAPEIFFMGDDSFHFHGSQKNNLGTVSYCLTSTTFDTCFDKDQEKVFIELPYPGKELSESISVDLINSSFLQEKNIPGETYRLKYYSKDEFFNQQSVQETFVYIDNVLPEFEINEDIKTVGDLTTLSVYLTGTKEIMECTFTLNQILPLGGKKVLVVPREEQIKNALFEDLKGIKFSLNLTCTDDAGNENSKIKDYVFDLEEKIEIIYPEFEGAVSETDIAFEINTAAGASCGLYLTSNNEKIAEFISDEEGKTHKTSTVPAFYEKEYVGEHKVVCSDLLDPTKSYEDYFNFIVDFSPPQTQIILREGIREEQPTSFGWEEFFIEQVTIDFECSTTGFECDQTYYCLGENCQADFFTAEKTNYQEYTSSIEVLESAMVCYYSTDLANNPVYQPLCGEILIEGYGINLEKPELHYYQEEQWGISNTPSFDFQFFTKVPTIECKFDFTPEFDYESVPVHKIKGINAEGKYLFENFPESVFTSYPDSCSGDDNDCVKSVYVKCKDLDGKVGPETIIFLEYDSTFPEIEDAYAAPDEIFEGITTELFVDTDDKTLCRYSDNSGGSGSNEYSNMEYFFPGTDENILNFNHQTIFNINFVGATKDYSLYTQCANGAGDLSSTEEINFSVDYSQAGYILENTLLPLGYVWEKNLTLSVGTSKNAFCKYDFNEEGYKPFTFGEGEQLHTTDISISEESDYLIPVKCMMGDHTVYGEIKFTYDLTSPTVTNIEDGNHTCGSVEINLIVNTDEQGNISKYFYQVYNQGKYVGTLPKKKEPEKKKSTLAGLSSYLEDLKNESTFEENETAEIEPEKQVDIGKVGAMVLSGETGPEMPIIIPALDLILGNEYTIKVKAVDAAGNEGEFAESDGIAVVNQSYWICQEQKPPEVFFNFNDSSCTIVTAEMTCQDASGCSILYGKSSSEALCNATADYTGNKLTFDKNGWICYHAEDYQNQSASGTKQVPFSDEDGDKILDHCDKCSGTAAGKIANEEGCADGEVPDDETMEDTDGDGLPDKWEKSYDGLDCSLNYASQDSDDNGVADNSEDYDGDSYNNYQEYLYGNNPCLADAPLEDISTIEPDKSDLKFPDISLTDKEPNILALIFLFLGILMILGGAGYLIYYYFYSPAGKAVVRPASIARRAIPGVVRAKPGMLSDWKEKLLQLKKSRAKKLKLQKRAGVFGKFGPESRKIPHLEKFISKKSPNLSHLQNMAQKYSEHKDEIKPGLKSGEKSIFNKLENIAKQTKDKKIHRVVNKSEANDIFNKLKNISKKRKRK